MESVVLPGLEDGDPYLVGLEVVGVVMAAASLPGHLSLKISESMVCVDHLVMDLGEGLVQQVNSLVETRQAFAQMLDTGQSILADPTGLPPVDGEGHDASHDQRLRDHGDVLQHPTYVVRHPDHAFT